MPTHQQAVRIHAIGRAGHQCAVVLPLHDLQRCDLLRFHDQDLIHLIGQHLIQHAEHEHVPFHKLIQVGEQLCAGEPPVPGQNAVSACAAHGQARPIQMAHGDLEDGFLRAVINGQRAADARDLDVPHHAKPGNVEQLLILRPLRFAEKVGVAPPQKGGVVRLCVFPQHVIARLFQRCHVFSIAGDGLRLVKRVPVIADGRIQQQGQSCKQDQNQDKRYGIAFFLLHAELSLPLWAGWRELLPGRMRQFTRFQSAEELSAPRCSCAFW